MEKYKNNYPKTGLIVTVLFNIYTFAWWLEIGKRVQFLGTIRFEFILGSILIVIGLKNYASKPTTDSHNNSLMIWIFIYIFSLLLSLPLAVDFNIAWDAFFNKIIKYSLMCFFISQFATSPKALKLYSFISFLAFLKIGQEAMVGKVTGSMVWQNQGILRLHGTRGTMFGHPNSLSGKTVSLLPFIWYVWPVLKKKWVKCLLVLQLIFSVNIILFTGSRTGYLTCIVFLLLIFGLSKRKIAISLLLLCLFAVSVSYIPDQYKDRFLSAFTGQDKVGRSTEARKGLFFDSIDVFIENPFGVGGHCFPVVQERHNRRKQETHNLYTQLLAETGVQGFSAFMGLMYVLIRKILGLRKTFRDCRQKINDLLINSNFNKRIFNSQDLQRELAVSNFCISMADALFAAMIIRFVLGIFGHDLFEIYWWIFCGIAMALSSILSIQMKRISELTEKIY